MIVKLQGGLGNQLWGFAFGISVATKRKAELFFDKSSFQTDTLRHYELDAYDLDIQFAEPRGPQYNEKDFTFDSGVYDAPPSSVFNGYWQNEKYLDKDWVRYLLRTPRGYPNEACIKQARIIQDSQNTCFIGVRRADYLLPERLKFHGVLPKEYYLYAALQFPTEWNMSFGIFTDDIPWCQENLPNFPIVNVNGPDEKHWDIWLMSLCQHAIIANSTFHWWGAYLGADKNGGKVIGPKKWFANGMKNEVIPRRWITL